MTRDVISAGPATGAAVMTNLNSHVSRLWDASALPLTAIGGTANAITATLAPALLSGLVTGMKFTLTWAATNTGPVTLSLNGATAQPVVAASGAALTGGALVAGTRALLEWVGTAFRVLVGAKEGAAAGPYRVTFTASGTWTVPTGYADDARVVIRAWGAGGGGSTASGAGGGGGGAYVERHLRYADLAASYTVTIGAGGSAGTAAAIGGNTTVGSLITARGGGGGNNLPAGGGGGGALSAGAVPAAGTMGGGTGGTSGVAALDALTIWGGGGGAISNGQPGRAVWGGGGGAGQAGAAGGASLWGGSGGSPGNAGVAPGGGGGHNAAGARGEVRIEIGG